MELLREVPGLEAECPSGVLEAVALEMADRDFQRLLGRVEGVVLNHGIVAPVSWVLSLLAGPRSGWCEAEVQAAVESLLAAGDLRGIPPPPGDSRLACCVDVRGGKVAFLVAT